MPWRSESLCAVLWRVLRYSLTLRKSCVLLEFAVLTEHEQGLSWYSSKEEFWVVAWSKKSALPALLDFES